ncbi:MAG TPA: biopolymer transporter ExbD [Candidatus Eisenbacteria bacterium]|nr:biopolymer transporter ExbD [Candidatus Eisenbacteria bacterium]
MRIPLPVGKRRARIEIIPLIDIVFFLLATFVMVSLSMVKNQGISVNLPKAATSSRQSEKTFTSLTVTKEDELYFNKDRIRVDDLPRRLAALKASDPDPKVLISGDESALLGSAIRVLDDVRKSGITKVSIQTKAKD